MALREGVALAEGEGGAGAAVVCDGVGLVEASVVAEREVAGAAPTGGSACVCLIDGSRLSRSAPAPTRTARTTSVRTSREPPEPDASPDEEATTAPGGPSGGAGSSGRAALPGGPFPGGSSDNARLGADLAVASVGRSVGDG